MILFVSCESKVPFNLGNGYYLDYDRNSLYTVFKDDEYTIKGQILELNYDSTYVIALVKPVDKIQKIINPNKNLNYQQQEKLINKSPIREYWILNKKMESELIMADSSYSLSNIFGPYNEIEYKNKKDEFKISNKLQLKNVRDILDN